MSRSKKPRRAPKGYVRGDLQEFHIIGSDGHVLPVIRIWCYFHKKNGRVLGFDISSLHDGRLEAENMKEWRAEVTKALRRKIAESEPTRHIAVVASRHNGTYRLAFWPVWRQIGLDGSMTWAEVSTADQAASWLLDADEIDWDTPRVWSEHHPWIWDAAAHSTKEPKILDWSPETWDQLVQVRRSLDEAIEKIGDLVTDPRALAAHSNKLLGDRRSTAEDEADE